MHQLCNSIHASVLHVPLLLQVPPEPDGTLLLVPGLQGGGAAKEAGAPSQGRLELHEQGTFGRQVRCKLTSGLCFGGVLRAELTGIVSCIDSFRVPIY